MADQTLGQRRAAQALKEITALEKEKGYGNFGSYVQRLPATIVMNGLGQAMAAELAASRQSRGSKMNEDERAHKRLFECVERWLHSCKVYPADKGLMNSIVEGSQDDYVRAQAEALAYLDWLKKFSQAYLEGGK